MERKKALIIGITGGSGGAISAALLRRGWQVTALHRRPKEAKKHVAEADKILWFEGDAMLPGDVKRAAAGVQVIVHAANPPKYRNWRQWAVPMLDNALAAAQATGARLVYPGSLYVYGPHGPSVVDEQTPFCPSTEKGHIRVEMEAAIARSCERGAKALIVRAGDFLGVGAPSSWFSSAVVKPGRPVTGLFYPGRLDIAHSWAYLPDLAETITQLLEREADLGAYEVFHLKGHVCAPASEMIDAVRRVVGRRDLPTRRFPWWAMHLMRPVSPMARGVLEMRYLWEKPLSMDNAKLVGFLGSEPHTPLDQALRETLEGLGCLNAGKAPASTEPTDRRAHSSAQSAGPVIG